MQEAAHIPWVMASFEVNNGPSSPSHASDLSVQVSVTSLLLTLLSSSSAVRAHVITLGLNNPGKSPYFKVS